MYSLVRSPVKFFYYILQDKTRRSRRLESLISSPPKKTYKTFMLLLSLQDCDDFKFPGDGGDRDKYKLFFNKRSPNKRLCLSRVMRI